jgi:hypothetical protein
VAIQGPQGACRLLDCFAVARPEGRASLDALWLTMTINGSPLTTVCVSYDFSRRGDEKEPLREGGCPLVSGEGWIGSTLTV